MPSNPPLFPDRITIGDKYNPAMEITDADEAREYFEACVEHSMRAHGMNRAEAESLERQNLGYFAGYYDTDTRLRVERLFACKHPVFGAAADGVPTAGKALEAGRLLAARENNDA